MCPQAVRELARHGGALRQRGDDPARGVDLLRFFVRF